MIIQRAGLSVAKQARCVFCCLNIQYSKCYTEKYHSKLTYRIQTYFSSTAIRFLNCLLPCLFQGFWALIHMSGNGVSPFENNLFPGNSMKTVNMLTCFCESIQWGWAVTNKAASSSQHGPSIKHNSLMTESLLSPHMNCALTDFSHISHIFIFELYMASALWGVNANTQNNWPHTPPMTSLVQPWDTLLHWLHRGTYQMVSGTTKQHWGYLSLKTEAG